MRWDAWDRTELGRPRIPDILPLGFISVAALWLGKPKTLEFVKDWKSAILGVWVAPGSWETLQKGGGRSPPPFARVSGAPGAAQTPKMTDFQSQILEFFNQAKVQPHCCLSSVAFEWLVRLGSVSPEDFSTRRGRRGRPDPKIDVSRPAKKPCIENPSVSWIWEFTCRDERAFHHWVGLMDGFYI